MYMTKGLFILACLAAMALQANAKPRQDKQATKNDNELPAEGRLNPSKLQALLAAFGNDNKPPPTSISEIYIDSEPSSSVSYISESDYTDTPSSAVGSAARAENDFDDDDDQEFNSVDNFDLELHDDDDDDDVVAAAENDNGVAANPKVRNALARQRQQYRRREEQQQRRRQQQNAQRRRRQRQEQQRRRRQRQQNQRRRQNLRRNLRLINNLLQNRNRNGNGNRNGNRNRRVVRIPV